MSSLFLLQFSSFLITLILAFLLVFSRIYFKHSNHQFEVSRWHLVWAMVLLSIHYVLQMVFDFRSIGDDVGAAINMLFYIPATLLISYSVINLYSSDKFRKRYMAAHIASIILVMALFLIGLISRHSLHIGGYLYCMEGVLMFNILFAIFYPVREIVRVRKTVERNTAGDNWRYNFFIWISLILFGFIGILVPIFIKSRLMIIIVGPVTLAMAIIFVFHFVCLGFSFSSVNEVLDSEKESLHACHQASDESFGSKPELSDVELSTIRNGLDTWIRKGGFANSESSLAKLSTYVGVSSCKLSSYLSIEYGQTFRAWLSSIRIRVAKKMLLDNPQAKIEAIAEECGFTSRSYFQNLFKAETGFTPREWRLQHQS